jgi:NQR2, RnfD, RnfE family
LNLEGSLHEPQHLRSRTLAASQASRQDVGEKATRACRLSPNHLRQRVVPAWSGSIAYNPRVLARVAAWLDRAAFNPSSLPDDLVTGIALAPLVAAGLIIFKIRAVEMLAIALVFGIAGQLLAAWLWRKDIPRPQASPLIAAVFGIALAGAGASFFTSIVIAALAVTLELLRARFMPAIRAQCGLLAFAVLAIVTRGAPLGPLAYINPASGKTFPDPIAIWYLQPALPAPYDPITLWVGNVAGPVFATSLMAVVVGIAWLAYARRLSFVVAVGFLAGAVLTITLFHWDSMTQLDSGPTWFAAGLLLSDRRLLPGSWAIRPVLGFGAGLLAVGLRTRGFGIEAAFLTVAGVQAVMAVVVVVLLATSVGAERWRTALRLRRRQAQLRVVKSVPRTS